MHYFKLTIAYDGTDFHGWQLQPNHPTIQGTLVEILQQLTQEKILLFGASRTDAGVHSLGQVASFRTNSALTPEEFQRGLNALLPPAIRIVTAEETGPDFHARWQARAKTYRYRIFTGRIVPPFEYRYTLHHPWPLDESAMAEAARLFEGSHDFTSFAALLDDEDRPPAKSPPEREIFSSRIFRAPSLSSQLVEPGTCRGGSSALSASRASQREAPPSLGGRSETAMGPRVPISAPADQGGSPSSSDSAEAGSEPNSDILVFEIRGRSFLRYMVRKITGTLLEIGRGKLSPVDIPRIFDARDRSLSGPTLPPHGLFLVSIEYPEPWR